MIDDKGSSAKKLLVEIPGPNNMRTPQKTNMEPENTPLENKKHLSTITSQQFLGSVLVFGGCSASSSQDSPATPRALWSRLPYYEAWQID